MSATGGALVLCDGATRLRTRWNAENAAAGSATR